jgi:uncharacterized membrane protein
MRRYSAKSHLRGSLEGVSMMWIFLAVMKYALQDYHDMTILFMLFVIFFALSRMVKVDKVFKDK